MSTAALRRTHPQTHLQKTLLGRFKSTETKLSHHNDHSNNHVYLQPTNLIGSFIKEDPPKNPKETEVKLASLRRDYAKKVKEMRKQYIYEMQMQKEEKERKDEARKMEVIRAREERNKSKVAAALARAAQRKAFEEEFRLTLMKERAEKLEYWRMREKAIDERKNIKKELVRSQSSTWIDENRLENKLLEAIAEKRQF